jgi:hypothetical protein
MHCADCGIDSRSAARGDSRVRLCIACQEIVDRDTTAVSGYNRRGSKDSQLR